jgi:carbamoyltransferase
MMDNVLNSAFKEKNLRVRYFSDKSKLIDVVTDLLADNKIVHWCQGREEFGPRALMNHSTLYTAQDPNGTHTLNQAMGRSEYMPYCPVCKNTSADELFENWEPGESSCRFMAMTMNCKPGVAEKYRGGVHVDNTARAQFIYENDKFTKDAWDILTSYERKTGNKMLINTSFNIHNTPTCNMAQDCWDAWIKSGRVGAALVIGNYLFLNEI